MRPPTPSPTVDRWLAAERAGDARAAEAALAAALAELPPLAPRAGFAARILVEMEPVPVAVPSSTWGFRWRRLALGALGAGVGLIVLWLPALLLALADLWSPADLVEQATSKLVALHLWILPAVSVGRQLALLWESVVTPLLNAPFLLFGSACLLVAAGAFGVLRSLVESNRRWVYADPS